MIREPAPESPIDQASKRLDQALRQLEQKLARRGAESGGLFDDDRARLAAELDQSRAREKELEAAGAEASAALGRAIAEIQSALSQDEGESGDEADETPPWEEPEAEQAQGT